MRIARLHARLRGYNATDDCAGGQAPDNGAGIVMVPIIPVAVVALAVIAAVPVPSPIITITVRIAVIAAPTLIITRAFREVVAAHRKKHGLVAGGLVLHCPLDRVCRIGRPR